MHTEIQYYPSKVTGLNKSLRKKPGRSMPLSRKARGNENKENAKQEFQGRTNAVLTILFSKPI